MPGGPQALCFRPALHRPAAPTGSSHLVAPLPGKQSTCTARPLMSLHLPSLARPSQSTLLKEHPAPLTPLGCSVHPSVHVAIGIGCRLSLLSVSPPVEWVSLEGRWKGEQGWGTQFNVSGKEGRGCWATVDRGVGGAAESRGRMGCPLESDPSAALGGGLWVGEGESHPQPPSAAC